jgi:hypothetical protein
VADRKFADLVAGIPKLDAKAREELTRKSEERKSRPH